MLGEMIGELKLKRSDFNSENEYRDALAKSFGFKDRNARREFKRRESGILSRKEIAKLKVCQICGNNKTTGNWHKHSESGIYPVCKSCSDKHPNSWTGRIKSNAKCRNKGLDKNSTIGKGFRAEQGIIKTIGLEN